MQDRHVLKDVSPAGNVGRRPTVVVALVSLLGLLSSGGCVSTAYISSSTDPACRLSKSDKIYVMKDTSVPIAQRKLRDLVAEEMGKAGFTLASLQDADYALYVSQAQETSDITGVLPVPTTSTTYGTFGGRSYVGRTHSTAYVPYSKSFTAKGLFANLYRVRDLADGKPTTVWEGYVGAEESDFDRYTRALVNQLLQHFGSDYAEHTPINTSYK